MKLKLPCSGCSATLPGQQHLHPGYLIATLVIVCAFTSSGTHSKVILRSSDLHLTDEHREVVADFKRRIQRHVKVEDLPPVDQSTSSQNATVSRQVRKILHELQGGYAENGGDDSYDDNNLEPVSHVFHSSRLKKKEFGDKFKTPSLKMASQKFLAFNNFLKQPEDPNLVLVMKSAHLRMNIRLQRDKLQRKMKKSEKDLQVRVYLLGQPDSAHSHKNEETHIATANFKASHNKIFVTIPLNVSKLTHILEDKVSRFHLSLSFNDLDEKRSEGQRKLNPSLKVQISEAEILVTTKTRDLNAHRLKRQSETSPCEGDKCCRKSINISVSEINWVNKKVIHPKIITFYYCKGRCPLRYKPKTISSSIQSNLHDKIPDLVPEPACAASGYQPIDLIVLENSNLNIISIPDVIVTGCMCS